MGRPKKPPPETSKTAWQPVGIELPRGWKDAIAEAAQSINCPMRYLWIASIDLLLSLPREELERRALTYELLARKNFEQLATAEPGRCQALAEGWLSKFATTMLPDGRAGSAALRPPRST